MKKILILCSMMMCCFSAFSQITFSVSNTTVNSDQEITITSSGENSAAVSGNKYILNIDQFGVKSSNPSANFSSQSIQATNISYYHPNHTSPTIIKVKLKNTSSVAVTSVYKFNVGTYDAYDFHTIAPYEFVFTVTVNPAPSIFYNVQKQGSFTRNNCSAGSTGSSVTYTVAAGTYSSIISQSDADQKAVNAVNANGQANANTNGTCNIVYSSIAYTNNFYKNNCDPHYESITPVPYTLNAGAKTSTVSQADANAQALVLFNTNGQANANLNGTCTVKNVTVIGYSNQSGGGSSHVTRVRVYTAGTTTLIGDFTEAQITAGAEIPYGTYDFVVTTSGTTWGTFDFGIYTATLTRVFKSGSATNYPVNNYNTTDLHNIYITLYFGNPE